MRFIVNADDYGKNHLVNKAIEYCFEHKIISSTTLLANMEGFEEAVTIAKEKGFCDAIGFHFNLVEGKAISSSIKKCRRLCDNEGNFIYKRNSIFFWSLKERRAIREELILQLLKIRNAGLPISHMDSHQHVHTELGIFLIIQDLLKKHSVLNIRLSLNYGISSNILMLCYKYIFNKTLHLLHFKTTRYFCSYFISNDKIEKLSSKDTEYYIEMMLHPKLIDGQVYDAVMNIPISNNNNNIYSFNQV